MKELERLKKIEEQEEKLRQRKKDIQKKVNQQKRRDRNHHMITFGAMVEQHLDIDHLNIYEKREVLNTISARAKELIPQHLKKENYNGETDEDNIYTYKLNKNSFFEDKEDTETDNTSSSNEQENLNNDYNSNF